MYKTDIFCFRKVGKVRKAIDIDKIPEHKQKEEDELEEKFDKIEAEIKKIKETLGID